MKKEFFNQLSKVVLKESIIAQIEKQYRCSLTDELKQLISYAPDGAFIENWRLLSTEEILRADKELHIPFTKLEVIPLVDTYDNIFIVYHIKTKYYSKMDIVDGVFFKQEKTLDAF